MQDLRFAFRQLLKSPGFTAVAVLTLAIGIGVNTAMFSVIRGVLLKPLPYPDPEQLVTLWERDPQRGIEQERVSGPNYLDWRAQNSVLRDLAASPGWVGSETFNLVAGDTTTKVIASYTSSSLFTTLGTKPMLGRTLLPVEDRKEGNRAAVLSYGLWQRQFGGNTNVIGRSITLDTYGRRDYTIVGVMPPGFGLPSRCELWLPMGWMGVTLDSRREAHWHNVIARLKPGVSTARAQAELNLIQSRIKQSNPGLVIDAEVAVIPLLQQALGRNLQTALIILWATVAGVLLIACANVANLLLARAASRQKEIGLRLALGAGRWRVVRQLLVESLALGVVGGALGVLFAWWALGIVVAASPANIPRLSEVRIDGVVLVFTIGVSLLTGVLFGLAPAWHCARSDLNETLKESARGASSGQTVVRTHQLLIVAEVALSVILLAGAGLMLRSFAAMLRADRGFETEHLLTAELDYSVSGFTTWVQPTATRPQVSLKLLMDRLRQLPGVHAVGAGSRLLRRENRPPVEHFSIHGQTPPSPEQHPTAEFKGVSPDWVRALGARLVRGRDFTEGDMLDRPGVVLINETLARRHFQNQDPVGQRLKMGRSQPPLGATNSWGLPQWSEIIGVVSDVKSMHPHPEAVPEVYASYWQWPMQRPTLLVRATGNPSALADAIRRATQEIIPNLPPPSIRTMDDLVSETVAQPKLQTGLLGAFAVVALLLAAIGLYGVLAYSVAQREREIGVRVALGAQRLDVLALIIGRGMRLVVLGLLLGLIGAVALTRVMRSLLYEVTPTDPLTLGLAAVVLLGAALLACWLPARRAARTDPVVALRSE